MTGGGDRTEGRAIALKSEAKDGTELEKSGEQGKAEQSKAKQSKASRTGIQAPRRGRETGRDWQTDRLTSWQGRLGTYFSGQGRAGRGAQDTWLEKF